MQGVMGKILWVDLTNRRTWEEKLAEDMYEKYLGGYGIGARLLYDRMPAGVDPMGPENILGFITGPLTGTLAVTGARWTVVGKSPKTGTWGDANCGGTFGPALKFSGYDGVFFTGAADSPAYLHIDDGEAQIRDATEYWDTGVDVEKELKARLGNVEVAWIGVAGENRSLLAAIMNDQGRAAGRSGLGAVMGAKNLKAVAAGGTHEVPVADPEGLRAYVSECTRAAREANRPGYQQFTSFGTGGSTARRAFSGDSPVKNWAGAGELDFPDAARVGGLAVKEYEVRRAGCWHCAVSCSAYDRVPSGEYATEGDYVDRPEYETGAAFGSMLLMADTEALLKATELTNRYGMDTISLGATISFAMECYEKGLITGEQSGGLDLTWGNAPAVIELLGLIARREGYLGELFADGVARAAAKLGPEAEEFAVHVHGEELPMHDPRYSPGLAIAYQVDATPGRHTQGGSGVMEFTGRDVLPPPWNIGKYEYDKKGPVHRHAVNAHHVVNAAGLCNFAGTVMPRDATRRELTLVTGEEWNEDRVQLVGERLATLRHAFNLREGLNPVEFKLPRRSYDGTLLEGGPTRDIVVDYDAERRSYFNELGWDQETAVPSFESLRRLGLDDLTDDLHGS